MNTLAMLLEQYMRKFPISTKLRYGYQMLQSGPLGETDPREWKLATLMDYGRARKANQVPTRVPDKRRAVLHPSTVAGDFTHLAVVLTWATDEVDETLASVLPVLTTARRKLKKEKVVAKAGRRTRRPTPEELKMLLAHFAAQNSHHRTEIDMTVVTESSYELGRRIGELVSIRRKHVDLEKRTYVCYQSKQRVWHEFVLFGRGLEIIRERLAAIPQDPDALLFPWNSKSCSQRYIDAKKKLGITDLRLHDNRRECFSRCFAKGLTVPQVQHGVSGHLGDAKTLLAVYTQVSSAEVHAAIRELEERA